jgi:hypothetical protein
VLGLAGEITDRIDELTAARHPKSPSVRQPSSPVCVDRPKAPRHLGGLHMIEQVIVPPTLHSFV